MDRSDCPGFPGNQCPHGSYEMPFWHVVRRQAPGDNQVRGYCESCAKDIDRAWLRAKINAAATGECKACNGRGEIVDARGYVPKLCPACKAGDL